MKLASRHFSGAQNLEVARTSLENIWNLDANFSCASSKGVTLAGSMT